MRLPSVQSLLKKYGIRPRKRLGQHFLAAQPTMQKIVDALGAKRSDIVLEIGCGLGIMTALLAERVKYVYAVDADINTLEIARKEFGSLANVEWIHADILKTDLSSIARAEKVLVIGNIPYNISSPILFHLLDHREHIARAVLMLQKEVADRVVARPGGKQYGALSVMMQSYAGCRKLFNVLRTNFVPQPDVTSSVIELSFSGDLIGRRGASGIASLREAPGRNARGQSAPPYDILRRVVQAAFQKRRKTLRNALIGSSLKVRADELNRILGELGIDPKRRPETLSVEEFNRLAMAIQSAKGFG